MTLSEFEELQISFPADLRSAKHVFDNEDRKSIVTGNNQGPQNTWFTEDHVVAPLSYQVEALQFKNTDESLIRDRGNPRHLFIPLGSRKRQPQFFTRKDWPLLVRFASALKSSLGQNIIKRSHPGCFFQEE